MSAANRIRRLLGVHGGRIAAVLLVVGVLALAGAALTYASPPTETVTEQRNAQTVTVSTNTSAVVTQETPLYEEGERLVDLPVYFFSASPELTLTVRTDVPDDQPVAVTQRLVVHMDATRDGVAFWEETRLVAADERIVRNGTLVMRTTLNMSDLRSDVRLREGSIGDVGSFSSELRVDVSYETEQYAGEMTASSPLTLAENAYWLDSDLEGSETESETVRREVAREPDMGAVGTLGAVGLLALLGALGVVRVRRDGPDPETVQRDIVHQRYEEWISKGEFPTGTEKRHVFIETLEDLVDIAIDSNKRVVFDPEFSAYAVVDGDLIYYYTTERARIESWLDV